MTMTYDPHRHRELRETFDPSDAAGPTVLDATSDGLNVTVTLALPAFDRLVASLKAVPDVDGLADWEIEENEDEARREGRDDALEELGAMVEEAEASGVTTLTELRAFFAACDAATAITQTELAAVAFAARPRTDGA